MAWRWCLTPRRTVKCHHPVRNGEQPRAEVLGNIANVAPYDGAVNYIRFDTDQRQSRMLRATRPDGAPLPFGTEVLNERGESVGYVGRQRALHSRGTTTT